MGLLGRRGGAEGSGRPLAAAVATGAVVGAAGARSASAHRAVAGGSRYQMRQRMFSIGNDFFITDAQGQTAFKVDGKLLRVRSTLFFEDAGGNQLYKIQERMLRVRDSMTIERPDGSAAAKVHNALITPLRDRWTIDIPGGAGMSTKGNIVNHEYRIEQGGAVVATVSKRWFRIRDTYGVETAPGQDDALLLAITVVIDMMAHEGR
ncbi:LURP-one-related/scramblase family protein [Microlunatus phosphovorus]|uniref:LURP-one-related/scramblase family protein n=1 Tax=Microlunatus phosphovorus TaxID=29405 RepID=UPI00030D7BA2|nr:LURP-one-related family protein [Microlunatus phosphovorus]